MAKYGSPSFQICLLGGRNLLDSASEFSGPDVEEINEETTNYGDAWFEHTPVGLKKIAIGISGWYDDDVNASNEAYLNGQLSSQVLVIGLEGNTIGKQFCGFEGVFSGKYSRLAVRNGLNKANCALVATGKLSEGIILQKWEAKTADWNTEGADSFDSGASSALGGAAFLQVSALSGFTGFVGKIRHSADDVTYADLATFANVTAAPASERIAIATGVTINRYLAFDGNVTGSGSITVFGGFARG